MLTVTVTDRQFDIDEGHLADSQLIQYVLQLNGDDLTKPIPIYVELDDWLAYLDYLNYPNSKTATVGALRVIDYLENPQQAKEWADIYFAGKQSFIRQGLLAGNLYERQSAPFRQFIEQMKAVVRYNTGYDYQDLLPVGMMTNFEDLMYRNQTLTQQEVPDFIRAVINCLFSNRVTTAYTGLIKMLPKLTDADYMAEPESKIVVQMLVASG